MSLYRFIRNEDGTIDTDSVREIVFDFQKRNGISNGSAVIFAIDIEKSAENYEYAIGRSTIDENNESAKFFFLKLAGTDRTGGNAADGTGKILEKIDFLQSVPETFPETTHLSALQIDQGTVADTQVFYYNAYDDKVHYYTTGNLTIEQQVTSGAQSTKETTFSDTIFPPINTRTPPS